MNAQTRMSGKGQVVIPKDVRERLRLSAGDTLEVIERSDGVLLRKSAPTRSGRTAEEIFAHMREIMPPWNGPPVSIEDMNRGVDAMFAALGKDAF